MKTSDFYYDLPEELIAQTPLEQRDRSRLLCLDRKTGDIQDAVFSDVLSKLKEGDCLILNDSRVLPARIHGHRVPTGGGVELLLLQDKGYDHWEVLAGPGKKARPGDVITFGNGILTAHVLEILEGGNRLVKFTYSGNFYTALEQVGEMPLPPYITEKLENQERYQTVYSRENGSAAAPTAGLHFTPELLEAIREKGVKIGFVTLHVGLGTFRPVKVDNIHEHHMHSEHYELPPETAQLINETKKNGGRVIAVGTTSCRTLESVGVDENGLVQSADGWTEIFIYPGYQFQVLDGLITNFHLPESTLIMLVSAFAGYDHTMQAYKHAVNDRYRFFSFGDAMFII
ncbi:MAG: tRNA preQ1(34) S-adenosylmethionine ribosyltransferase-isomerase QueA [Clostridia bacterium]|nr:tRNA preQ1(34) S-adenosylmethionine ribosyltransferase-isomerase QueA [Clostridia bacterium]